MAITGPLRLIPDEDEEEQKRITARFLGEREERDDREYATGILQAFLDRAFRRPATPEQVEKYVGIAMAHIEKSENPRTAYEDILWALVNTKEFLFNH